MRVTTFRWDTMSRWPCRHVLKCVKPCPLTWEAIDWRYIFEGHIRYRDKAVAILQRLSVLSDAWKATKYSTSHFALLYKGVCRLLVIIACKIIALITCRRSLPYRSLGFTGDISIDIAWLMRASAPARCVRR